MLNIFSFRQAHKIIGDYLYWAMQNEKSFIDVVNKIAKEYNINFTFSPTDIIEHTKYGGGPGKSNLNANAEILKHELELVCQIINQSKSKLERFN